MSVLTFGYYVKPTKKHFPQHYILPWHMFFLKICKQKFFFNNKNLYKNFDPRMRDNCIHIREEWDGITTLFHHPQHFWTPYFPPWVRNLLLHYFITNVLFCYLEASVFLSNYTPQITWFCFFNFAISIYFPQGLEKRQATKKRSQQPDEIIAYILN